MLIVVPLIAALWPGIRVVVDRYNTAIDKYVEELHETSVKFELVIQRIQDYGNKPRKSLYIDTSLVKKAEHALEKLNKNIDKLRDGFSHEDLEERNLPKTWAFGFFASVCVIVANLLYQVFAPNIIKKYGLQQYIIEKKTEYIKAPTDTALNKSIKIIKYGKTVGFKPTVNVEEELLNPNQKRKWELDIKENAAFIEYCIIADQSKPAMWTSTLLFLLGIGFILYILFLQCKAVSNAAGLFI